MPNGPVISKIRVSNPNLKGSRIHNRNHLLYIATRDGVDLSDPLLEVDREDSSNELYLKYINERPRSHGLFGNVDCSDIVNLANHVSDETAKGKSIYRGIISLTEDDAVALGYNQKQKWVELVNKVVPDVAKEFNIPISRLQYCAAVHMEKGHPHVHYMFWDSKDKVRSPYIHPSKQNRIREMISGVVNEEEIRQLAIDRTMQRDLVLDLNKDVLTQEIDDIVGKEKILGRIKSEDIDGLSKDILKLTTELPTKGKWQYKLLPEATKIKVDAVVDKVLELPAMKKEYGQYLNILKDVSMAYSASDKHTQFTLDKNSKDLRKRLANQVLKSCTKIRDIADTVEFDEEPADQPINTEVDEELMEQPDYSSGRMEPGELPIDIETSSGEDVKFKAKWSQDYKWALKRLYDPKVEDISSVIETFQKEASKGNVLAINELGKIYYKGIKVPKDEELGQQYYKVAFKGFSHLAASKSQEAWERQYFNYRLGKMHESGWGTEQDYQKAISRYQSAYGNKYAEYSLASLYLRHKGIEVDETNEPYYYKEALKLLRSSAEKVQAYASYSLSKNSENRNALNLPQSEIDENYEKAAKGFESLLHDAENDFLLYRLGTMYHDGKGVEQNRAKAFEYFKRSAELNNANGLYALGKYYADEKMDLYNPLEAEKCFLASVKEGNEYAKCALALLYQDKTSSLYNIDKAVKLLQEAIENDNSTAYCQLGKIYLDKETGYYNQEKSIEYLEKASGLGNMDAVCNLGKTYADKNSEYYDLKKGIEYLEKAAGQGNANAMYQLGKIYSDKESPAYDIHKAVNHLNVAAEKGNSYAMAKLGTIYLWGKHSPAVEKDVELGLKFLNKAVENGNEYAQDQIKFYENFKDSMMKSMTYSMIRGMNYLASGMLGNRQMQENLHQYARQSKEYRKIQARLHKHGRSDEKHKEHDEI